MRHHTATICSNCVSKEVRILPLEKSGEWPNNDVCTGVKEGIMLVSSHGITSVFCYTRRKSHIHVSFHKKTYSNINFYISCSVILTFLLALTKDYQQMNGIHWDGLLLSRQKLLFCFFTKALSKTY